MLPFKHRKQKSSEQESIQVTLLGQTPRVKKREEKKHMLLKCNTGNMHQRSKVNTHPSALVNQLPAHPKHIFNKF